MSGYSDVAPMTADQEQKLAEFRAMFADLTGENRDWCDDACLQRYLRARDWNLEKSSRMLRTTLKWRDEFRPQHIKFADIDEECCTGKLYVNGYDRHGHPIFIMRPACQNTKNRVGQMKLLAYMLERAVEMMPSGVEKLLLVIDFKGYGYSNAPDMQTSKETLNILSNHYPERLFKAICVDPPWLFYTFYKVISPFVDPVTIKKVLFVKGGESEKQTLYELVAPEQLERVCYGISDFVYDHPAYRARLTASEHRPRPRDQTVTSQLEHLGLGLPTSKVPA